VTENREEIALQLPADVVTVMRQELSGVAEQVIAAVIAEVPSYADPFSGRMGRNIEIAVHTALDGFLDMASRPEGIGAGEQVGPVLDAAYQLGRGEARSGRTMDALARAYRVGARVAWRDMSAAAVAGGLPSTILARFAELVFTYIDELSDASVTGHADELAASGRVRARRLERMAVRLLEGTPEQELVEAAERADWSPPRTLTAVVLPEPRSRVVRGLLDPRSLTLVDDVPALGVDPGLRVLLVPDATGRSRTALLRVLADAEAVIGPAVPWKAARTSYLRAMQANRLGLTGDTDLHLVELVLGADPEARAALRARVLAPMEELGVSAREKLEDTLRSWLLHQGRREEIAGALFVHPQTVRYRMGQLRTLYADRLDDPRFVLEATIALGPTPR
jgi:PucR C-terminal helix-turn-helix domain